MPEQDLPTPPEVEEVEAAPSRAPRVPVEEVVEAEAEVEVEAEVEAVPPSRAFP